MWYFYLLAAVAGAAIALAIYICLHKALQKGRADAIIAEAEAEGENIKKEKILQAKEKFLQMKTECELRSWMK